MMNATATSIRRLIGMALAILQLTSTVLASEALELIRDPAFSLGFSLLAPAPGAGELGRIGRTPSSATPVWQVAQWHSQFPLTNAAASVGTDRCASNQARWLLLTVPSANGPTLTLGVDSRPEYGRQLRRSPAEPWVHLLVQQEVQNAPPLAGLASLRLRFEGCLRETETFRPEGYSPSLHAAQFQIVLTLNNTQRSSPGFGDYLWFVMPVFDDRYEIPPAHVAQDFAVTQGKLIYNPGGAAVGLKPMRIGAWQTVDCELRPWLVRALQAAWKKGYLRDSQDLADYRVAHLNLGWEVPGLNRATMDLRDLSLSARRSSYGAPPRRFRIETKRHFSSMIWYPAQPLPQPARSQGS